MFGRSQKIPLEAKALSEGEKILSFTQSQLGLIVATEVGLKAAELRIPWPAMFQASFDPPNLDIRYQSTTKNQVLKLVLNPILEPNDFPNLVRAKVTSNVIAQMEFEYEPELMVTISARRVSPTEINFVVTAGAGIETNSPTFQFWAKEKVAEFKETFGF